MPDKIKTLGVETVANGSVSDALRLGAAFLSDGDTAQLDARVLLKTALNADEADLIARAGEAMSEDESAHYVAYLNRRKEKEPVAYITGVKEFWSLEFTVTPDVLIPRNDSECLIEAAIARRGREERLRILDLGVGSGCLLCALLSEFQNSEGAGVDRSAGALGVAAENARRLGLANRASFLKGDWLAPVEGVFDIIIANPPYIPDRGKALLAADVSGFEPGEALFGGSDGFETYRRFLPELPAYLAQDGLLLAECGFDQTEKLAELARDAGLSGGDTFTLFDLAGRPRGLALDRRKPQKKD